MADDKFYAQFGEDKILYDIFKNMQHGICVEVGGYDGVTGSNTYFFEKLGWQCLVIEPMPEYCKKIRAVRNCDVAEIAASDTKGEVVFHVAEGVETLSTIEEDTKHFERINKEGGTGINKIQVKTDLLTNILLERGIDRVDFLTLDVEWHELRALKGLSLDRIQIRLLIVEDASFGRDRGVKNFLKDHSYVRFKRTGCNDWYTKKDDPLVTWWSVIATEVPIFLYVVKQKIKPFVPRWLKRS
ncbi:MAG: hypothetical protein A2V79_06805 [Betaproteobacteria bacterium RBG_16_56_24]|nr:MAG: hypothetical protein A2V79_06805 [Betaproteobacteria bacterium RBG_16_56_24]